MLTDLGLNPSDVLRRAGLPDDLLAREDVRIDASAFFRFYRAAEEMMGDPLAPLRVAEAMTADWFTPPLFAAMCSPDLAVAARRLARFKPLVAPVTLAVDRDAAGLTLAMIWPAAGPRPPASFVVGELLFLVQLARIGTRHRVVPLAVTTPAVPEPRGPYEAFLGVRIHEGPRLAVRFANRDADRPFLTANAAMWAMFEPRLRKRLADLEGTATFTERTRAVLLEALPSGQYAVDQVARRLAVSARTLQRRLRAEGTSFQGVTKATREELARHYLSRTHLSSSEIAYLLGFEEPSSFFRAFHAWTGQTPETVRRATVA